MEQVELFSEEIPNDKPVPPVATKIKASKKAASEGRPLKRRAKVKRQVEDYYALLNVSEDASPEFIKQKYLEKIKQFPPEKQPEQFKVIRRAYDTLRDQVLRKQYDILRRFGESIEDLVQEAGQQRKTRSGMTQAITLLSRALKIDPQHTQARLALAFAQVYNGNMLEFAVQFSELKQQVSAEEWPEMWASKIAMLCECGRYNEAYAEIQRFRASAPQSINTYWGLYADTYEKLGREDELLVAIEEQICVKETPAPDDISLYIAWINLANAFEKRSKLDKAQATVKKFIKRFRQPAEASVIASLLSKEYVRQREELEFGMAKVFVDLALMADRNDRTLQEYSRDIHTIDAIMRELTKAEEDCRLFPLVLIKVISWLAADFDFIEDTTQENEAMLTRKVLEEMQTMDVEYAAGIVYLKKKYPTLFRQYQQRWEQLFNEKSAGMNREDRRGLRI